MICRCLLFVLIFNLAKAQSPCRVNVIFGVDASNYENNVGEAIIYDQINHVESTYQTWSISSSSVQIGFPKPIGCNQGGSWTLQNDVTSLNNVVKGVMRFLYACFKSNTLSDYINSLNQNFLVNVPPDSGRYVFVIFTSTTDSSDVQQAINLRQQYFDPQGYGLIVVQVQAQAATYLQQLATSGFFALGDPDFTSDITAAVCRGQIVTAHPTYLPTQFTTVQQLETSYATESLETVETTKEAITPSLGYTFAPEDDLELKEPKIIKQPIVRPKKYVTRRVLRKKVHYQEGQKIAAKKSDPK